MVNDAFVKAKKFEKKKGPLEEIWDSIQLLFGLIKDWASGDYKDVPIGSIILIIIGILYFVSPRDLDKYYAWKENQLIKQ